ncbi:MAG: hypothetical protein II590_01785, partial [Clostridia bacterium]|nr:hypothetical protein [Clostridia bacterium]
MGRQFENRLQKLEKLVIEDYGKERVIDRLIPFSQPDGQVIEDITSMGKKAGSKSFKVAGKTGTAQISHGTGGYHSGTMQYLLS